MLAGRPPFVHGGGDELTVARMHLADVPAPPGVYAPCIPPELENLVLRLLSKDPADRYPSARALTRALDCNLAAALHGPGGPRVAAPLADPPRTPSRLRWLLGTSAILLLLSAPGGALLAGLPPTPVSDRAVAIARNVSGVAADFYGRVGVVADGLAADLDRLRDGPAPASPSPDSGAETTGRIVPFAHAPRDLPPADSPEEPAPAPAARFAEDPRPASHEDPPECPQALTEDGATDAPSGQSAPTPEPQEQTFDGAPASTGR